MRKVLATMALLGALGCASADGTRVTVESAYENGGNSYKNRVTGETRQDASDASTKLWKQYMVASSKAVSDTTLEAELKKLDNYGERLDAARRGADARLTPTSADAVYGAIASVRVKIDELRKHALQVSPSKGVCRIDGKVKLGKGAYDASVEGLSKRDPADLLDSEVKKYFEATAPDPKDTKASDYAKLVHKALVDAISALEMDVKAVEDMVPPAAPAKP